VKRILQEKKQFIVLNQKNFEHNVSQIKSKTDKKIIAVVKANAYGHGLIEIAKFADSNHQIAIIATHSLTEALELRHAGIKKKILVLAHVDAELNLAKKNNVSVVVFNFDQLNAAINEQVTFHLKFNTGLNRLGFNLSEVAEVINILQTKKINTEGLFSHFAESDAHDVDYTKRQIKIFDEIIEQFSKNNIEFQYIHLTNSTGFLRSIDSKNTNAIRCCGSILGLKKVLASQEFSLNLLPVLSWFSPILQIKDVAAGEYIGYGRTYCTKQPARIAVIATGYADGYPLTLSNCGFVSFNNQLLPIVGRICMNMLMVDISNATNINVNDFVELIGEKISLADLSIWTKMPIYFIACGINSKITKITANE
jgi:alanine racemase